jgi:hypothetical protein
MRRHDLLVGMIQPKRRPPVSKAVRMTPEQQRRQDIQVAWLEAAIKAQNRAVEQYNLDPWSLVL